jgi:hypothetical protein
VRYPGPPAWGLKRWIRTLTLEKKILAKNHTVMIERGLRMGEWNNGRQWNTEVGRRHQTF